MRFTYKTLIDRDSMLNAMWKSTDWRGKPKPNSVVPQEALDAMMILYGVIDRDLRRGETRFLLPRKKLAQAMGVTDVAVHRALARLLRFGILVVANDQPQAPLTRKGLRRDYAKRYELNPAYVVEQRPSFRNLDDLERYVWETEGNTLLFWRAFGNVRNAHSRATVPRMVEELERLSAETAAYARRKRP